MALFGVNSTDDSGYLWLKFLSSIGLGIMMPFFLAYGFRHSYIQWSSYDWPKTTMTITKTEREEHRIRFYYTYQVDGQNYVDDDVTREMIVTDSLTKKYSVGSNHAIYYYPSDPGTYSVLSPGGNWKMQLFGSSLGSIVCLILWFNAWIHYEAIKTKGGRTQCR